ncbi:helix-turn-helix domain-containing protein [Dickeya zeae]|uniref:helix-turn-helix domain-containing protein n=1 Tax=Dickeya zeae TaxID=204042 RepID=UPI001CF28900|nr:helix-turn-helix domain-containing protein [Dickeya zeae]
MRLTEYIEREFNGNRVEFAKLMGVTRQKVNDWLNSGWIVHINEDGTLLLCSVKREIPRKNSNSI